MRSSEPIPFAVGDVVRLKKPHPCGSHQWTVVRLGADIGLKCHGCSRRVLLPRREVERRLVKFLSRAEDSADHDPGVSSEAAAASASGH